MKNTRQYNFLLSAPIVNPGDIYHRSRRSELQIRKYEQVKIIRSGKWY